MFKRKSILSLFLTTVFIISVGLTAPAEGQGGETWDEPADVSGIQPLELRIAGLETHFDVGAEERGQSEAIARNLITMTALKTPIISTIIGEGGSGGALAIGVADKLFMMKYSTYSVISPEGIANVCCPDPV